MEGYRCFGCDPHSERGLRMEFYEDGDEIVSVWHPRPEFQGWVDTVSYTHLTLPTNSRV